MMKMSFIQVKRPYKRRTPKELWSKTTKRSKKEKDKKEIVEKPKKLPDNSLGQLAKQFIGMAAQSSTGEVDLHDAATHMNVRKRRIYDVTNVLDGIGLFRKTAKNRVGWIQGSLDDLTLFNEQLMYEDGNYDEHDPKFFEMPEV